jgi:hypothetical protein
MVSPRVSAAITLDPENLIRAEPCGFPNCERNRFASLQRRENQFWLLAPYLVWMIRSRGTFRFRVKKQTNFLFLKARNISKFEVVLLIGVGMHLAFLVNGLIGSFDSVSESG